MRGRSLVWLLALYLPTELLLAFLLHTQSPSYPFSYASVVLAAPRVVLYGDVITLSLIVQVLP